MVEGSSEISVNNYRVNHKEVQAMIYYLVFSEGMTLQMREQAIRLYEELN